MTTETRPEIILPDLRRRMPAPTNVQVHYIDIDSIKTFVSRARPKEGFKRMKQTIKEIGLKIPIQVRDISSWPTAKRGRYKYELIVGEGRLKACRELGINKIPALIIDVPESEVVSRFLTENVMRKRLPWQAKARLMKSALDRIGTPTKADLEALAARYCVTVPHVAKLVKILRHASPQVQKDIDKLTVEEAEELTSLPARGQDIVIQSMQEAGVDMKEVATVVKKAKNLAEHGTKLSKTALKATFKRDAEALSRINLSLKPVRLHFSNGPENIARLLSDPKYRKLMDSEKIGYARFEEAMNQI